ncbi:tight adherence pilus pseudopilin TadF [Vibrio ulleungensis]|uniref:ATP-binding protein n=1 Tax=Vibrio ulleungensis TaxID=2807619 RepID=A0ABS2HLN9_9VIBR|nr:tight adherence pilus pseudopilin TadF [Vibrio ulleungensis]MBM7038390.1 ATP-binding protein [Vibrio ulleungensis]
MTNSISRQKGVFIVEFTLMLFSLVIFILFTMDVMFKVSTKGKLDRIAFSAVSIAKERTQLYDSRNTFSDDDAKMIYQITSGSLARTMGDFDATKYGIQIEAQNYTDEGVPLTVDVFSEGSLDCSNGETLSDLEPQLRVTTSWGRNANLYRVVTCYDTENYVAGVLGNGFTQVGSSAVMVGR